MLMRITSHNASPDQTSADAIVVGVYEGGPPRAHFQDLDARSGDLLSRLQSEEEVSSKLGDTTLLYGLAGIQAPLVLTVGMGRADELGAGAAFRAAAAAVRRLASKPRGTVAFFLDLPAELTADAVAGAVFGSQGQDLYRSKKKVHPIDNVLWADGDAQSVRTGEILGESINLTRRLVDQPPQEIYPESFAATASEVARELGLEVEVWDEKRLRAERCGSLLAVAKGSARPPRLVILHHRGSDAPKPDLALVGKGVTFDSGGLLLKSSESMLTMKCDMAGAATVLGAMCAIASMKLPLHVVALMGLVENMPGPEAMKLGDVLTARNGKTIEVQHTDAEGRLVLADVLAVAVDMASSRLVDLATLTGSCVVALGRNVAGLMTNDQAWCDQVAAAARHRGEPAWQLPMFREFDELIESDVADIKNVGDGRWGGAITAAKFLEQFVGDTPWTHIDIAGPAFADVSKPWLDGGATGAFVRTLTEVADRLSR